ncbi:uncharacterized protein [Fopius arisanus]|uniref:Rpl18p protein n=1 Tax=Fopius arisanus TaxID=64838 RepID=A0A0C9RIT3_9HYME|nr:PREDICTED: uncharacterized protein LOC105265355 [Fopius arisanus]
MKAIIIVSLLVPLSLGDQKIHPEDIERDNHPENRSPLPQRPYSPDPEAGPERYMIVTSNHVDYTGQSNGHNGDNVDSDIRYQMKTEDDTSTKAQSPDNYVEYPVQIQMPKRLEHVNYRQHLVEWPRPLGDHQYQMNQQRLMRYPVQTLREAVYIPASQLLAYSRNFWLSQALATKNSGLLQHLAPQIVEKSPAAVYSTALGQSAHTASTYAGYPSAIDPHPEEILPAKVVLSQPQIQYLQEFSYKPTKSQADVDHVGTYASTPVHAQGQAVSYLQSQLGHLNNREEPKKVQYNIRLTKPVYRTQTDQRHLKVSDLPRQELAAPLHSTGDDRQPSSNIDHTPESKSLLGSYIPSHVIAAQDAARYRERPLKLEGGFLPSKMNFFHVYGKRKSKYTQ